MRRRALLTLAGSAFSLSVAGCSDDRGTASPTERRTTSPTSADAQSRPDVDCAEASRPDPPAPDADNAVRSVEYSGTPPGPIDDESAVEYLEAFEPAYRRNAEIARSGTLVQHSGTVTDTQAYDAPAGVAVVRFETVYSRTLADGGHYDSSIVCVSYYLDPTVVVRAEQAGGANVDRDALDPDPVERGRVVACFE